jgi:hypothetical protein
MLFCLLGLLIKVLLHVSWNEILFVFLVQQPGHPLADCECQAEQTN